MTRFYTKAIDQLSKKVLYPNITEHGLGVFAANDVISGANLLEIIDEYSISSFDPIFPDYKKLRESFLNLPYLTQSDHDMITLIFNIMYFRYSKRTLNKSRFMKIFMDNIPNIDTYGPAWDDNEKAIFLRLMNRSNIWNFEKELFGKENPVMNYIISFKMETLHNQSTRFVEMLSWENIKAAANIAYSRSIPINMARWKEFYGIKKEEIAASGKFFLIKRGTAHGICRFCWI